MGSAPWAVTTVFVEGGFPFRVVLHSGSGCSVNGGFPLGSWVLSFPTRRCRSLIFLIFHCLVDWKATHCINHVLRQERHGRIGGQ